jgi:hypothetical protein
VVAVLVLLLAVASCTSVADPPPPPQGQPGGERAVDACGPPRFGQIGGRVPRYLDGPLDAFPNDRALCAGLWLPRAQADFTPQGLAVDGRTAYVSGYDGGGGLGTRFCRLQIVDLRTGRLLAEAGPIEGQVGSRPPVVCRHGGGLLLDGHGLWLVETDRLWLLDPETLAVERAWALIQPVRGSFAVHDGEGRLGVGGFRRGGRARLFWFDPADVLAGGVLDLTESVATDSRRVPAWTQGAVWGDLGPGRAGVWFATSHTYCGVLVGPGGARRGFLPGAEGLDLTGRRTLWALSESATRPYQRAGGRPVVPMLARFDISDLGAWERPDCQP